MEKNSYLGKSTSVWIDTTPQTNYPALSGDVETDIAIIGGGIAGLMAAFFLKQSGLKVAILESSRIAEGTTGYTTAKITSAHGFIYDYLIKKFGFKKAKIYADANEAGIEKIAEIIGEFKIDCDFRRLPAYTYVIHTKYDKEVEAEFQAAKSLGLPVSLSQNAHLPFAVASSIKFENQAQFHPRKFLLKIASEIDGDGSHIFEETTFLDVKEKSDSRYHLITDKGKVIAKKIVIATNYPVYDPAGFFARLVSRQSFAIGAKIDGPLPPGIYYSIEDNNFHSLRTQPISKNEEILIIGGELYRTGKSADTMDQYKLLAQWTKNNFPLKSIEYHWTTNDSESYDRVPMIGHLTPGSKNLFVATGFTGWGMAHGVVAGMILAEEIQENHHPWSDLYSPNRFSSLFTLESLKENIKTVGTLIKGKLLKQYEKDLKDIKVGQGKIIDLAGKKTAVYRDEKGKIFAVSAVCTHMGCIVGWNNAEKTWDCPCHGSRFNIDGSVIHGPAIKKLDRIDLDK